MKDYLVIEGREIMLTDEQVKKIKSDMGLDIKNIDLENYLVLDGKRIELSRDEVVKCAETYSNVMSTGRFIEILESGEAEKRFSVGDTIKIDGYCVDIIGFNHDKIWSIEEISSITLMARELATMPDSKEMDKNKGWKYSKMNEYANNENVNNIPEDLIPHIRLAEKVTHNSEGQELVTYEKVFLPSESEMFGSAIWAKYEDGKRYEAFKTSKDRVRKNEKGVDCAYWTRSLMANTDCNGIVITRYGDSGYAERRNNTILIPICFCLGMR